MVQSIQPKCFNIVNSLYNKPERAVKLADNREDSVSFSGNVSLKANDSNSSSKIAFSGLLKALGISKKPPRNDNPNTGWIEGQKIKTRQSLNQYPDREIHDDNVLANNLVQDSFIEYNRKDYTQAIDKMEQAIRVAAGLATIDKLSIVEIESKIPYFNRVAISRGLVLLARYHEIGSYDKGNYNPREATLGRSTDENPKIAKALRKLAYEIKSIDVNPEEKKLLEKAYHGFNDEWQEPSCNCQLRRSEILYEGAYSDLTTGVAPKDTGSAIIWAEEAIRLALKHNDNDFFDLETTLEKKTKNIPNADEKQRGSWSGIYNTLGLLKIYHQEGQDDPKYIERTPRYKIGRGETVEERVKDIDRLQAIIAEQFDKCSLE